MTKLRPAFFFVAACWSLLAGIGRDASAADTPFELKDGDRVVFVGGTFIEREGQLGYIESSLVARFPERNITFRNLGQSGDTVLADARNLNSGWAAFGPAEQGFGRLKALVGELKPTVIFANFGMTESFAGVTQLNEFSTRYEALLEMLRAASAPNVRIVLVSPNHHERMPAPYPDPSDHNQSLQLYRDAIKELAKKRGDRFVDLYAMTEKLESEAAGKTQLTSNGLHPTAAGYALIARELLQDLGLGEVKGKPADLERLRKLIVQKNAEFFNYWRPQNNTYILGYRNKEQGRNAVEIPKFLPLVEAKEKQIAASRRTFQP